MEPQGSATPEIRDLGGVGPGGYGTNGGHIAKTSPIELYKFLVTHCGYMNGKTSFGGHRSAPASYQIFPYYSIVIGRSLFLGLIYSLLFSINLVTY